MIATPMPIVYSSYGGLAIGVEVGDGELDADATVAYVDADDV